MTKSIDRRHFTAGIVAASMGVRRVLASTGAAPEPLHLKPNGWVPNNVLPVLIYLNALTGKPDLASELEHIFTTNQWPPQWRNGIYSFHHYHSTAHEVLGIAAGQANIVLGGEGGEALTIHTGDVLVLPAGTGHCRITASEDLLVIGAYPEDEHWDICRTAPTPDVLERMRHVRFPASDPVTGSSGELPKLWGKSA